MTSQTAPLTPGRTALLLMDFQHTLLKGISDPDRVLESAQRAQRAALAAGIREIHVRVAFTPEDHANVPAHNKAFAPLAEHGALSVTDPDTAVHPLLCSNGQAHTVTKTRVGAFSTTSLDAFLREQGIDTLVLAGIFTSGAVLSTVREAADRDYRLLVLGDGCADPNPQLHTVLMESVLPAQADILDVASFEASLESSTR